LLPRSEKLSLEVPLEVSDIPSISLADHAGTGHREGTYDGMPHLRRNIWRSIKRSPLGFFRFLRNAALLELAAKRRKRTAEKTET